MSHIADNPFRVLGLTPGATTREVEREAAKLLGMLELGVGDVGTYATPMGPRVRTAEAVRAAAAALRDPRRRLSAEMWIGTESERAGSDSGSGSGSGTGSDSGSGSDSDTDSGSESGTGTGTARWDGALRAAGWGPR